MNEEMLKKIEPNIEERMKQKINRSLDFCRMLLWLNITLKKYSVAHSTELAKFLKIEVSNAYKYLMYLVNLGLLKAKSIGNVMEFIPVYEENDKKMMIENYVALAEEKLVKAGVL